jgi:ubiquinone/menaquinone biosynthesis C-methylase UbiE
MDTNATAGSAAPLPSVDADEIKTCCAAVYQSDWARLLLGDTFHPGGLALTERLGQLLELDARQRVLDVAAGNGTSAIFLAQRFGCVVVGVDYGEAAVQAAAQAAEAAGVGHLVRFARGDAERLPIADSTFDAVICECAFCTFPDKTAAAREFARVLRPGGRVGLADLTRNGSLPAPLEGLLAWVACIADARPVAEYVRTLVGAGLVQECVEPLDGALRDLVRDVRTRLLAAELLVRLQKIELPAVDFEQARTMASAAADAVHAGLLGYTLVTAARATSTQRSGA